MNKVIDRAIKIVTPISKSIMQQVCILEVKYEILKSLKITNKANIVLYDSAWTARVDNKDKDNKHNNNKDKS